MLNHRSKKRNQSHDASTYQSVRGTHTITSLDTDDGAFRVWNEVVHPELNDAQPGTDQSESLDEESASHCFWKYEIRFV
jgi:hypothetical protein